MTVTRWQPSFPHGGPDRQTIERLPADAGYRSHNAPTDYKFRVYTSGQKRRLTPQLKRELRRPATIELLIGHLKAEHRMGRNYLAGDAVNALLAAAGHNFHLLLRWLELVLSRSLAARKAAAALQWV
jgi:IS5 family transposase